MTTKSTIKVPSHLQPATKKWWLSVCEEWDLEDHHRRLLTLAGEAWDRCCQAREAIDENGPVYTDRFGTPRARPEIAIERDSRLAFARLIRELSLDQVQPPESRLPRLGGQRH